MSRHHYPPPLPQRRLMEWRSSSTCLFRSVVLLTSFVALLPFFILFRDYHRVLTTTSLLHHGSRVGARGGGDPRTRSRRQRQRTRMSMATQAPPWNEALTTDADPNHQDESNNKSDCLVVFHLPKCGGTSLLYALRYFALERGWQFYNYHSVIHSSASSNTVEGSSEDLEAGQHRAIHYGHLYSTFLERSQTSQCLRMTLLRDPIDRVISHFYYWNRQEKDWPHVANIAQECSGHPQWQRNFNQFSNLMTRMLMGAGGGANDHNSPDTNKSNNASKDSLFPPHLWNIFQPESNECQYAYPFPEWSGKSAIEHLQEMDLVCFMDDMEGCLRNVRKLLRLDPNLPLNVPHKNSNLANSVAAESIGSGWTAQETAHDMAMRNSTVRQLVASVNQADIALYDWAVQHMKKG